MASERIVTMYAEALALTERMLEAAQASDWEGLVRAEQARDRLVEEIRLQDVDPARSRPELRGRKRELIESIMRRDTEVRALTEDWMHELRDILASANNSQRLSKTYDQS